MIKHKIQPQATYTKEKGKNIRPYTLDAIKDKIKRSKKKLLANG